MSKILTVAWRDFKHTVLRKVFLVAILGLPLLIVSVMAIALLILLNHEQPPLVGTIAIVDPSGEVLPAAEIELQNDEDLSEQVADAIVHLPPELKSQIDANQGATRISVRSVPGITPITLDIQLEAVDKTNFDSIDQLKERVRNGELLGVAVFGANVLKAPDPESIAAPAHFSLYVHDKLKSDHARLIERRLGQAVVRVRANRVNMDVAQAMAIVKQPSAEVTRVVPGAQDVLESPGTREFKQIVPMAFMMLLFIGTFTAAQHLMMSTIEEKSNRVMEVLLSAVSPMQLMTGKIIGQGCVGLLLMGVYGFVSILGLFVTAHMNLIDPINLVYLVVYFFMGYFMVASLMAAIGGAVSDIREANTLVAPVMMVVMIPWFLWLPISHAPNGMIATVFSFIPPATPFVMILRLAAEEPVPFWQIPASIGWGFICVVGMMWLAARIFRVGVLMYGKPPSPIELLRWVRYS